MNDDIYEIMNQLEQYNGELLERHHTDKKKIERLEKKLKIATEDLYVIASNANPDFNRMEYAEKSLQKIKELNK